MRSLTCAPPLLLHSGDLFRKEGSASEDLRSHRETTAGPRAKPKSEQAPKAPRPRPPSSQRTGCFSPDSPDCCRTASEEDISEPASFFLSCNVFLERGNTLCDFAIATNIGLPGGDLANLAHSGGRRAQSPSTITPPLVTANRTARDAEANTLLRAARLPPPLQPRAQGREGGSLAPPLNAAHTGSA